MFRLDRGEIFTSSHGLVLFLKIVVVGGDGVRRCRRASVHQRARRQGRRDDRASWPSGCVARSASRRCSASSCSCSPRGCWRWRRRRSAARRRQHEAGLAASLHITNDGRRRDGAFSAVVGPNAVRVEVDAPETGLAGLAVDFTPPAGTTVRRTSYSACRSTAAGIAVLPIDQGFPLGSPGVVDRDRPLRRHTDRLQDRAGHRRLDRRPHGGYPVATTSAP